ncbi:RCBT1 protein, partial [Acromyrmex insinuator]
MVYHFGLYCHDLHIDLITRGIDTIDLFPEIKIGACGRFSFIFINNSLMIEGTDRSVNFCELYSITLNLIPFSPKITVKVATGFDHILVLTTEGKVYGWGVNTHGQLNFNRENLSETTQIKSPSKIFIPNVNNVSDIAAMKYISAFKSSYDGRIYIQGCLHNLKIKRLAICEYTNIFDRYNSSFHSVEKNRIYTEEDKNILDDLSNAFYTCYFSSEFMSDLTIEVNGEFIYVHKSILKMRSLYFKNMFAFNEVENRKRVIEYDDYPYSTYRKFFKFFYTGWVYSDYINQMIELLILADKFCVTNLEKECIKYLKIHMKPSTVSYIKEMAIKYNKAELEQYCDAYELREAYDPTQIIL